MRPRVVKIGGRPLGDPAWVASFAAEVARAKTPLVIVHGGGPEIDALSTRLGVAVERQDGRRITSPAGLEVAGMVLSGVLNKRLVAALLDAGVDALGLSGEDGALILARVAEGGTLGRVGEVERVRTELLLHLLSLGLTPVLSPISRGVDGGALNVNADDAAVAIACALGAEEFLFLTDVSAVRDERGDLAHLREDQAAALLQSGVIRDGMAVKVRAGLRGLDAGLDAVRIGGLSMLLDGGSGTLLGRQDSRICSQTLLETAV
jgi:acetylglutamate kinase